MTCTVKPIVRGAVKEGQLGQSAPGPAWTLFNAVGKKSKVKKGYFLPWAPKWLAAPLPIVANIYGRHVLSYFTLLLPKG